MGKTVNSEDGWKHFISELQEFLQEEGFDLDIAPLDRNEQSLRCIITLNKTQQYARMFKIPNMIYDEMGIEASEIMDISGSYTTWLLTIPNT